MVDSALARRQLGWSQPLPQRAALEAERAETDPKVFTRIHAHFRVGGRDLSAKVDYARYYARTLYDRELHDRLLGEVLAADPVQEGFTLFNTLAQQTAQELLDSADDYF